MRDITNIIMFASAVDTSTYSIWTCIGHSRRVSYDQNNQNVCKYDLPYFVLDRSMHIVILLSFFHNIRKSPI